MAIYEFQTDDGNVVEVMMSFAEFDKRVKDGHITLEDGRTAKQYWGNSVMKTLPANYPMVCTAAGVHPGQIKEHTEHLRRMGCGYVEHNKDGDVIFQDKKQRKKVCEALGLYDRNGSYGDPQARNRTANVRKYR